MKDLHFLEWLRTNTQKVVDANNIETGKIVYYDSIYNEDQLFEIYKSLKVTEVNIKGFNQTFNTELRRKKYMTMEEVIQYVRKEIIETADVLEIIHRGENGDCLFKETVDIDKYN